MDAHLRLPVHDPSQAGEARRTAGALATRLGFDETEAGRLSVVVTEAATNIVKHAGRGELLLRALRETSEPPGVELLALDRGPGMSDVARCLEDGFSTAGSAGTGLGAISRLSSSLEIYSRPGSGTALLARLQPRDARPVPARSGLLFGAVRVPAPGESACGDVWAVAQADGRSLLMVADGLGHGEPAAHAAGEAARVFDANKRLPVEPILEAVHRALRATRGAAVSIAERDARGTEVRYVGVGNVCGAIVWSGGTRGMVGQNGTAGGDVRTIRAHSYAWVPGASLLLYSDGLTSHVGLSQYPGLLGRHPSLVAGVLYRDFARGRDDATVLVARDAEGGA